MKILLVNDYATATGGAEIITLLLREGLRARGIDARLFATTARSVASPIQADYLCMGTTTRFRTLLQTANPWAVWRLRRVLYDFLPDVVHVNVVLTQLSPLILPLLRDVPSLYHAHWFRSVCPLLSKTLPDGSPCHSPSGAACYRNRCLNLRDGLPLAVQAKLWRRWREVFKLTIANSAAVQRMLLADGLHPVEVVWCGIPERPVRGPLSSPPTLFFAGRLDRQKGADVLLLAMKEVAASLPEARLLIAGDGPDRTTLEEMIARLGLSAHVSMLGHLSHEEVEQASSDAWVQVIPSRFAEAFGIVAAEAMMRGKAVVASACGGLTELIQDGQTGSLVPPDHAHALAEALIHLLQRRELVEQMGQAGREFALNHLSMASYIDRFVSLYERLASI